MICHVLYMYQPITSLPMAFWRWTDTIDDHMVDAMIEAIDTGLLVSAFYI